MLAGVYPNKLELPDYAARMIGEVFIMQIAPKHCFSAEERLDSNCNIFNYTTFM